MPLDTFVAGFGQRFDFHRMQIKDLRLTAKLPDGTPLELKKQFEEGGLAGALGRKTLMARLKSELEVTCPCCQSTLVIDTNLGRVVSHKEPERGNKPELSDAQRILAEEAARREAIFQQSVDAEKTRGDALSRRFEEALKQAQRGTGHQADARLRSRLNARALSRRVAPAALPSSRATTLRVERSTTAR